MDYTFDDIFALLQVATALDESKSNRIEAATKVSFKIAFLPLRFFSFCALHTFFVFCSLTLAVLQYYEAVYLMEMAVRRIPQTASHEAKKRLLQEKIRHYRARASDLMADESSTMPKSVFLEEERDEIEKPAIEPMSSPRSVQSDMVDSRASQANTKLAEALDLDEEGKALEAIKVYLEAAEIYLEALKAAEQHISTSSRMETVTTILKRRLESTFDRVHKLKKSQSSNKIVENSLKNRSVSPVPSGSPLSSSLTQEEISVLMRSSTIASKLFLPWSEKDAIQLSKVARSGGETLYKDPDGYLSLARKAWYSSKSNPGTGSVNHTVFDQTTICYGLFFHCKSVHLCCL